MVISKAIGGTSGTSGIASGGEKLRRSRRLSSTRGLRAPRGSADDDGPGRKLDARPEVDGESNERVGAFHAALETRAENRRRVTDRSEPVLDLLNVSGFPASTDRKCQSNAPRFDDVLRSDSKYEIGLPSSSAPLSGGEVARRTSSKDICTLRKRCKPAGRPEVAGSRAEVSKPDDSIAKRLEVIHELNRKILANYHKFQHLRSSRKDERSCDKDEAVYAEIKKRNKPRQELKSQHASERIKSADENGAKKSSKKSHDKTPSNCDANENFSLASRTSILGAEKRDLRTRITRAAYSVKIKAQEKPAFRELTNVFERSSKDWLENSRLYPETGCESCTMTRRAARENPGKNRARRQDDEDDLIGEKKTKGNYRRGKDTAPPANLSVKDIRDDSQDISRKLPDDQRSAGKSDVVEGKNPRRDRERLRNDCPKFTASGKSAGGGPAGLREEFAVSEKFAREKNDVNSPVAESVGKNDRVLKTDSRDNLKCPAGHSPGLQSACASPTVSKKSLDPRKSTESKASNTVLLKSSTNPCNKDLPSDDGSLEKAILATLNATLEPYDDVDDGTTSSSLEDSRTSNAGSFSSDSIVARTTTSVAAVKVSSFEVSWDSGVGVDVLGNGGGWCRIHTGIESSLVYLTLDTTARDVCRDMLLGEEFAVYVQYGGEIGRRLAQEERPLELQDFYLQQIGYSDVARRARLGVDPELRHLIAFHVGPASPLADLRGHSRCGQALVLKGLVFPQWKRRPLAVLGSRLFLYAACSSSEPEWMELAGGSVCNAPSRLGKLVLRVTGYPRVTCKREGQPEVEGERREHHAETRHLYLGFQHPWDRDLWRSWLKQATQSADCPKRLDLSRGGLSRIPDSALAFPAVEEILLGQNRLSNPSNNLGLLQRFPKLQTVQLESNDFPRFPRDLLDVGGLSCLDLSDNKIEEIPSDINRLINLRELILDRNVIKDLPDEVAQLRSLRSISLAGNYLTRLPPFLTMRALPEVLSKNEQCRSHKDEKNNQNNLQKINLRNNQLKGNIILGNYGNLTHLDVSENSIEKLDLSALQELKSVRCARNHLTELTVCGRNLSSLIAGNNRLKKLTIEPAPAGLEHLDVSYNELDSLPEWIPDSPLLRALFASHNGLTSLPDRLLSQPSRLEVLHLPHNRLQALPPPRRPLNLVHLTLQGNALTALPASFFANTEKLKVLNLSNNRLSELPYACDKERSRRCAHGLEKLYLTANCLTDTALDALANFTSLRTLHVAYNTLDTLPESCIASWMDLEELVLSGNRLQYLPDNVANLQHLRVLRVHSNRLLTCPTFSRTVSLKVLDLAHNQLDRINLAALVPAQLQFLDISCNSRLHVDPRQFQVYRSQRAVSLVDVSGQNRPSLPSHPQQQEIVTAEKSSDLPWRLGFSETAGAREKLHVSQIRMPSFCNAEGLFGIFDGGTNQEAPGALQEMLPRLLLEERTCRETSKDYLKYTLLAAHRELKEKGQRYGIDATLMHLVKVRSAGSDPPYHGCGSSRYTLRVASSGDAKAVLCRAAGPLTLAVPASRTRRAQLGQSALFPRVVPDPACEEVALEDDDEFVILANRRFWEVLGVQEAVREARAEASPVLAAKRLQDLAQAYGAEDNLSVIVLRLAAGQQPQRADLEKLMRELKHAVGRNRCQENQCSCPCCLPREAHKPPGACCCHANESYYLNGVLKNIVNRSCKPHNNSGRYFKNSRTAAAAVDNESAIYRDDRSSPSGQSDQASDSTFKSRQPSGRMWTAGGGGAAARAASKTRQHVENNSARKSVVTEDALSDRSLGGLSEEQFRCWEYMLEQNTQLLFDKELDTLTRRPPPLRRGQSRSTPQLAGANHHHQLHQLPFLSKRFGSARSFNPAAAPPPPPPPPAPPVVRFGSGRRLLNGGPNAAYFGSLQRLMPYNLEYDFAVIQERNAGLDSLEQDASRMQQYWGVATTEL